MKRPLLCFAAAFAVAGSAYAASQPAPGAGPAAPAAPSTGATPADPGAPPAPPAPSAPSMPPTAPTTNGDPSAPAAPASGADTSATSAAGFTNRRRPHRRWPGRWLADHRQPGRSGRGGDRHQQRRRRQTGGHREPRRQDLRGADLQPAGAGRQGHDQSDPGPDSGHGRPCLGRAGACCTVAIPDKQVRARASPLRRGARAASHFAVGGQPTVGPAGRRAHDDRGEQT